MASPRGSRRPAPPDPNSPYLVLRVRRAHLVEDSLDALLRGVPDEVEGLVDEDLNLC